MRSAEDLVLEAFCVRRPDGAQLYTISEARFGPGLVALTGPNGSGKSTLLNALAGIDGASGGTARLGVWERTADRRDYARRMVFMPQNFSAYPEMSGFEFLVYLLRLRGFERAMARRQAAAGLAKVGLGETDVALAGYSQGMLQRLGIAYIGQSGAPLCLLDEPFAGIDPAGRLILLDWMADLAADRIMLICTHHVDELMDRGARKFDIAGLRSASGT